LANFETEEQLDTEINNLHKIRTDVAQISGNIKHIKYFKINVNKSSSRRVSEIEENIIEICPSIIDEYDMRNLKWCANHTQGYINNAVNKITGEIIYSHIYNIVVRNYAGININNIDTNNVLETIYAVYIFRKRMERTYLDLVKDFEYEDKMNFDEILNEINKKIVLLYEKLSKLM